MDEKDACEGMLEAAINSDINLYLYGRRNVFLYHGKCRGKLKNSEFCCLWQPCIAAWNSFKHYL